MIIIETVVTGRQWMLSTVSSYCVVHIDDLSHPGDVTVELDFLLVVTSR